jgi:arylformamidase
MGLPRTTLKGAVMGSGMYDLKPVRMSARSKFVAFSDAMEQELSAQRHIDRLHTPLVLCIGTLETPEFQRQSRDFAAAVKAAGKPVEVVVGQHYNHFEVGDSIGHPYQLIGRELIKMMRLSMAT